MKNGSNGLSKSSEPDVLVIGGGVVGVATAVALAREEGIGSVELIERAGLGSATGSSKGAARIFCPASYPEEGYLDRALVALERWRRLEEEAGEELLLETGVVSVGGFAGRELALLSRAGVHAELLDAREARERCGLELQDDRPILLQPGAGVVLAARAHAALVRAARSAGVALRERVRALRLRDDGDRVLVDTDRGSRRCRVVVVAAGPWSRELLRDAGIELGVSVSSQIIVYFRMARPDAGPPVALIDYDRDEPYALYDPAFGLKAALHARGPEPDPDGPPLAASEDAIARLASWARGAYGEGVGRFAARETCMYTNTGDERFVIERHGRVVVASPCSGHGFQFAPDSGARAAALAAEALA